MRRTMLYMTVALILPVVMFAEDARLATLRDRKEGLVTRQVVAKMMVKDRIVEVGQVLADILKDPKEDQKMKLFAMKYLGELQYKAAVPGLLDIIKNKDLSIDYRKVCIDTVSAINDKQVYIDVGTDILLGDDVANNLSIAYLDYLGKSKFKDDPDLLVVVGQYMGRVGKEAKLKAMEMLAAYPSNETLTLLMIALNDKYPDVRIKAIGVVAKQAQANAVTLFISKLEEETDDEVRAVYASELNKLPMPKVRSVWIGDLAFWVAEEQVDGIKKDLTSALTKLKAANPGKGAGGPDISMPRHARPVVKGKK